VTRPSFYAVDGDQLRPLQAATGSWNRAHQNGVAVGGLLAQLIEHTPTPAPMITARLSIDIMKPVPFEPIKTAVRIIRESPRMQMIDAEISARGVVMARASAMRLRIAETPAAREAPLDLPGPDHEPAVPVTRALGSGHPMETRMVEGTTAGAGPGAYWTRFNADLVPGVPIPGVARAAMAADIASLPSSVLPRGAWTYANVDLSAYLTRPPVDEWVLVACSTSTEGNGFALVSSVLSDRAGPFGRARQTLFVAPHPDR
jgi:hypothetical protein